MSLKRRPLDQVVTYGKLERKLGSQKSFGEIFPEIDRTRRYKGHQVTDSSGNRRDPKSGHYLSGGKFFTCRIEPDIPTRPVSILRRFPVSGDEYKYSGPITVPVSLSNYSGFTVPSRDNSSLDPYGATAIKIIDPTNPNAQAGVALGEILKDKRISLPGISGWKRRTEVAKAAGSEYLSAVFGWLPLVNDVKNTSQSIRDANTIIRHHRASSGTKVHREFAFDDITSKSSGITSPEYRAYYGPASVSALSDGPAVPLAWETTTTVSRWFSGSFTYAAPDASSIGRCLGVESEIDKLFGLTLTPDVLWELTPWSWAIDWFSNAGDVLSNFTSFKLAGLVMNYGYMMEETTIETTWSMPASGLYQCPAPGPLTVVSTTKRRQPANPFGFGVAWEGLSPTQLAITAALGITRL